LGSTLALADTSGVVATSYAYTPYGVTTTTGAASTNAVQYTGRENDANGLYYYRARYYNPTTGRFISEDPLGLAAGINLYAYAADDPVDLNDPSGMILPIVAACLGGAAFNVAFDLIGNWLSGRKTTLGGLLFSAATGCIAGLIGFGLGKVINEAWDAAKAYLEGLKVARTVAIDVDASVSWATRQAPKMVHIFDNAAHNLEPLVRALGSREAVLRAVVQGLGNMSDGGFDKVAVVIGGQVVVVSGLVENGVVKIGTMYVP
jgi:RHS repeat-associated protein